MDHQCELPWQVYIPAAVIVFNLTFLTIIFLIWAKPGLFLVNFLPLLNTMTNVVQNLTINGKIRDSVLGIETQD